MVDMVVLGQEIGSQLSFALLWISACSLVLGFGMGIFFSLFCWPYIWGFVIRWAYRRRSLLKPIER